MKITIEMDSIHELYGLLEKKRIVPHVVNNIVETKKKDPIWARELYEAYHRANHPGQKGFFTKGATWPEEAHEQNSFTMDIYDELETGSKQMWQDMANLIGGLKK